MSKNEPKLSLAIPCYNEEKNIPLILDRLGQVIKRDDIEVLLVNNGSTDKSAAVMSDLLPPFQFARVVTVDVNQGYGFGILSGLRAAKGEYLGWTHADMQTDPYDPIKALELIEQRDSPTKVYIKGLRKGRPFLDNVFTVGMSVLESLYLTAKVWDINAQPNIFHRSFFESWSNPPHDFSLDLYALYMAKQQDLDIVRFDVLFPDRTHGESHWNTSLAAKWKFIRRTIDFSLTLKRGLGVEVHSA